MVEYNGYANKTLADKDKEAYADMASKKALRRYFNGSRRQGVVIDYGGRIGENTRQLDNCSVVELDEDAVRYLKGIGVKAMASKDFPFDVADGSVDTVFSSHVLEHVESPVQTLRLFHRKLKPTGKVHLILPIESNRLENDCEVDANGHLHGFTVKHLATTLDAAGFKVVAMRYRLGSRFEWVEGNYILRNLCMLSAPFINLGLKLFGGINVGVQVECIAVKKSSADDKSPHYAVKR